MSSKYNFHTHNKSLRVRVEERGGSVCLWVGNVEVGFFDDDGLNLYPDTHLSLPNDLTEEGYLKVVYL